MPRSSTTAVFKDDFAIFLGRVMRDTRRSAKLTAREVGRQINVGHAAISFWETGRRVPNLHNLRAFGKVVGIPAWKLMLQAEFARVLPLEDKHANRNH